MSSSVQYFFIQKSFPYWFCRKDQMPHGLLNYFQYLQQYLFNVTVHFLSSVSPQSMMKVKSSVQFSRHSKITFSSVQSLSHVRLYGTPRTAALQASLSITNPWSLLKLMSIELVMPSNHLILCRPLLLLPSILPSIRVFSNESALHIR